MNILNKLIFAAIISSYLAACGGSDSSSVEQPPVLNVTPTASTADEFSANENTTISLDGSASNDSDGTIVSYSWLQTSGVNVAISGADQAVASFAAPDVNADTSLVFELTVTDNDGATDSSNVLVIIIDSHTSKLTDSNITWTFKEAVPFGKFANGSYWVVGPVTIESISPDFNGTRNGFEVNPSHVSNQGFDSRIANYVASSVPSLPYLAQAGESIVKAASVAAGSCKPCLQSASVLSVLEVAPLDNGARTFRPAYFGSDKTMHSVDELQLNLLPNLAPTTSAIPFDTVAEQYSQVQLDHKINYTGRALHPINSMPDYGSEISASNSEAALALMMQGTIEEKLQAVINYVGNGLDIYYMFKGGVTWRGNGGHGEGRKLPAAMAAVLLGNQTMKDDLANATDTTFGETSGVYFSSVADKVLWGQIIGTEYAYWQSITKGVGSKTMRDPYQLIDGGRKEGTVGAYQYCCTSKPWEAVVAAMKLMPELGNVINKNELVVYTERWRKAGFHTQSDSCAPASGQCSGGVNAGASCTTANRDTACGVGVCDLASSFDDNYGILFGPDPEAPGQCIADTDNSDGIGRFPQFHGTSDAGGLYTSSFSNELWNIYL